MKLKRWINEERRKKKERKGNGIVVHQEKGFESGNVVQNLESYLRESKGGKGTWKWAIWVGIYYYCPTFGAFYEWLPFLSHPLLFLNINPIY